MYYPDLPDVLGVPGVPRIPVTALNLVSQGLGGASRIMSGVTAAIRQNPLAALSSIALDVADATGLVNGVGNTFTAYPSARFNRFASPVGMIQSTLGSITTAIVADPSGPVSDVADLADVAEVQLDETTGSYALDTAEETPTLDADGVETVTVTGYKSDVQWGIVKDGKPVIEGDNFISLEFKKDFVISDYQIEKGGFASYNKVTMPFDARLAVSCGGSRQKRAAFLESIKAIQGDLLLYDVVMPEDILQSVNVQHVDFKRTAQNGVGIILAYIYVLEIRDTVEAAFATAATTPDAPATAAKPSPTATKSPAGAATRNNGTTQTKAVAPSQGAKINEALAALVQAL